MFKIIGLLSTAAVIAGCASAKKEDAHAHHHAQAKPAHDDAAHAQVTSAKTKMQTAKGLKVKGDIEFKQTEKGVQVMVNFSGVAPGAHGFHIHEKGDCSAADFTSAGGHFNPDGHAHGALNAPNSHAGDLGNLDVAKNGKAKKEIILDGAHLHDFIGKAVILHDKADDYSTQPTGNAGGRIACGVIEVK